MKKQIFIVNALSLCLLTAPLWAMKEGAAPDPFLVVATGVDNQDHDDSSSSDSESSTSSFDSESTHGDKKSKTFFIHIANAHAGAFYKLLQNNNNFSVSKWKREQAKTGSIPQNEKFFKHGRGVQKLCRTMKQVMRKFAATQALTSSQRERGQWFACDAYHSR